MLSKGVRELNILSYIECSFGKSPKEIQTQLGVSEALYSYIKNGKRNVSKEVAIKIWESYGVPFEKIFESELNDGLSPANPAGRQDLPG